MTFSALTDPLIAGIARGSDVYKLVGSYVTTPLNWYVYFYHVTLLSYMYTCMCVCVQRAVITGTNSKYHTMSDLKDTTIGISRPGRYILHRRSLFGL